MARNRHFDKNTKTGITAALIAIAAIVLVFTFTKIINFKKTSPDNKKDEPDISSAGSGAEAGKKEDIENSGNDQDNTSSDSLGENGNNNNPDNTSDEDPAVSVDQNTLESDTSSSEPSPAPLDIDASFYAEPISDEIFARINGKSYPLGCTLSLNQLRYVHVLHYDFNGEIKEGEIIVNTAVAEDVVEIFRELFDIEYPIEKMKLIDEYNADDELSMEDNNTSAFNYRFIAESTVLSNHALGRAIDINPLYNPYVYTRKDGSIFLQPYNAGDYVDRDEDNPYYIRRNDECYNIFISHGFTWGGDWNTKKDYQHFEKTE